MGLCKCPQRKVTNIFCYEHRVNVCEHCLMQNHPKCVVDTYRNWITDSVYTTLCTLCEKELERDETVRLLCFHIIHWSCLDAWARQLPPTTAPAGYTCPICKKMCLFPASNQVSPIAAELRRRMNGVNWARVGLGLSLLEVEETPRPQFNGYQVGGMRSEGNTSYESPNYRLVNSSLNESEGTPYAKLHPNYTGDSSFYAEASQLNLGSNTNARKAVKFDTPLLIDDEENKYRRRSPFESLSRWMITFGVMGKRRALGNRRKTAFYILGFVAIIMLLMVLFGRGNDDNEEEPFRVNPHVNIGNGHGPHP